MQKISNRELTRRLVSFDPGDQSITPNSKIGTFILLLFASRTISISHVVWKTKQVKTPPEIHTADSVVELKLQWVITSDFPANLSGVCCFLQNARLPCTRRAVVTGRYVACLVHPSPPVRVSWHAFVFHHSRCSSLATECDHTLYTPLALSRDWRKPTDKKCREIQEKRLPKLETQRNRRRVGGLYPLDLSVRLRVRATRSTWYSFDLSARLQVEPTQGDVLDWSVRLSVRQQSKQP